MLIQPFILRIIKYNSVPHKGDDNVAQLTHGGKLFLKKQNREKYNSWIIFPQCPKNDRWPNLNSDAWDKKFKNKITKPNKSLNLVI